MNRLPRALQPEPLLARLRWGLMLARQALGFAGGLAMLVIAAAVLIDIGVTGPARAQDSVRRAELESAIAARPQEVFVTEPSAVNKLPTAQAFAMRLERVLSLLQEQGFSIDQTNLAYSSPGDAQVQRLDVEIPVTGSYPALRRALDEIVQQPAVRVENLVLERKDITASQLAINLKVSLLGVLE